MKKWLLLILLAACAAGASVWTSRTGEKLKPRMEELKQPLPEEAMPLKKAVLKPGRVVELDTNKGKIAFVLMEEDCPKTTARIAELVGGGFYDDVEFERVESWLIQTGQPGKEVTPIGCEVLEGLTHTAGAVGMARKSGNPNSATGVFYVLLKPAHHLDGQYTVFGYLVEGVEVAKTIKVGDRIKKAVLRPISDEEADMFRKWAHRSEASEQKE